ncbi:MAG: hypothetical protein U0840_02820 [Gemmataceae bacterium]
MNVAETRSEMLACVTDLRARIATMSDPSRHANIAHQARRKIERLRKSFKKQIDKKANERFGFPINAREGIERKLTVATAEALAAIEQAMAKAAEKCSAT